MKNLCYLLVVFSFAGCVQMESGREGVAAPGSATIRPESITADTDILGLMLQSRGLNRETARFDSATLDTLAAQQAMVQPHFLKNWKNPYEFPRFVYSLTSAQEKNVANLTTGIFEQCGYAQIRTNHRAGAMYDFIPPLAPDSSQAVLKALEKLYKECRIPFNDADKSAVESSLKGVPVDVQAQVAKLILAAREAKYYHDRALRHYPPEKLQHAFDFAVANFSLREDSPEFENGSIINWDLGQALDYDDLYTGAGFVLKAICEVQKFLAKPESEIKTEGVVTPTVTAIDLSGISFEINTPLGKVAFNGKNESNIYQGEDYLAIVDLAGNDTYNGAVAASYKINHPVSLLIDWAGDDTYTAVTSTACAQGAGILGYGFLVDKGGNDSFTARNNAQGMCYFGVGMCWVEGGDDKFKGHTSVQGSAAFGVANLVKIGGNDSYYAYYTSQGVGFTDGYAALIDTAGDDRYVAEPYDLILPVGHDLMRNYSFCQGGGWGQRGDTFGGHSMAGGTGVLQDLAGNDTYECGVFGQGTAYWYGIGILHDKAGNDKYEASYFVQSGTVHMGLTMLLDEAGDDSYHLWRATSQAGAHDMSVSWFIDKGGNNSYSGWGWRDKDDKQTLVNTGFKGADNFGSVGSAINNSIAVFMSINGNDTYEYYTKETFGWSKQTSGDLLSADSWRYNNFNIGMFIDIGGTDAYNTNQAKAAAPALWGVASGKAVPGPGPAPGSCWSRAVYEPGNKTKVFGMGISAPTGRVPEAER